MGIHRIDDRAEFLLRKMASAQGKKPAAFISELIKDYAAGLEFDDPDLEGLDPTLPSP